MTEIQLQKEKAIIACNYAEIQKEKCVNLNYHIALWRGDKCPLVCDYATNLVYMTDKIKCDLVTTRTCQGQGELCTDFTRTEGCFCQEGLFWSDLEERCVEECPEDKPDIVDPVECKQDSKFIHDGHFYGFDFDHKEDPIGVLPQFTANCTDQNNYVLFSSNAGYCANNASLSRSDSLPEVTIIGSIRRDEPQVESTYLKSFVIQYDNILKIAYNPSKSTKLYYSKTCNEDSTCIPGTFQLTAQAIQDHLAPHNITIKQEGKVIDIQGLIKISHRWAFSGEGLEISLDCKFGNTVCGAMSGNYNGDSSDDLIDQNIISTFDFYEVANMHAWADFPKDITCDDIDDESTELVCIEYENVQELCTDLLDFYSFCQINKDHHWSETCERSLCGIDPLAIAIEGGFTRNQTICALANQIDTECTDAGYGSDFASYCTPTCGENEVYKACASDCPLTSANCDLERPPCDTCSGRDCQCDNGFFRDDNGLCVSLDNCEIEEKQCPAKAVMRESNFFRTFDKFNLENVDVESCGTYLLSESCSRSTNDIPYYSIRYQPSTFRVSEAKNGRTKINEYGNSVTMYYQGRGEPDLTKIVIRQKPLRADKYTWVVLASRIPADATQKERESFAARMMETPFNLGNLNVHTFATKVEITTDYFTLRIFKEKVKFSLDCEKYTSSTCGIFGNFNDDAQDDLLTQSDFTSSDIYISSISTFQNTFCDMKVPTSDDDDCFDVSSDKYTDWLNICENKLNISNSNDNDCLVTEYMIQQCAIKSCMADKKSSGNTRACDFTKNVMQECLERLPIQDRIIDGCSVDDEDVVCDVDNNQQLYECVECVQKENLCDILEPTDLQTCEDDSFCNVGCSCAEGFEFNGYKCVLVFGGFGFFEHIPCYLNFYFH